jgi:hypothetical protein
LAQNFATLALALAAEARAGDHEDLAGALHSQDARLHLGVRSSLPEWTRENFHMEMSRNVSRIKKLPLCSSMISRPFELNFWYVRLEINFMLGCGGKPLIGRSLSIFVFGF